VKKFTLATSFVIFWNDIKSYKSFRLSVVKIQV